MTTATARFKTAVAWAALLTCLTLPVLAQPGAQKPPSPPPAEARDPLGRDTPRGTITRFNEAAHRKEFAAAAQYMQATAGQRRSADELADDLTQLIDRYYLEPITSISDEPDG